MDTATRDQIIITAAQWAGPYDPHNPTRWHEQVRDYATVLAKLANDRSPLAKHVTGIGNAKVIPGTILDVQIEQRSTRALVTAQTRPTEYIKDGIDKIRTERTDKGDAELEFARDLYRLRNHKVLLWIEIEKSSDDPEDKGYRVIRDVEDLCCADSTTTNGQHAASQPNGAQPAQQAPTETFSAESGGFSDAPPTHDDSTSPTQAQPVAAQQATVTDF